MVYQLWQLFALHGQTYLFFVYIVILSVDQHEKVFVIDTTKSFSYITLNRESCEHKKCKDFKKYTNLCKAGSTLVVTPLISEFPQSKKCQ